MLAMQQGPDCSHQLQGAGVHPAQAPRVHRVRIQRCCLHLALVLRLDECIVCAVVQVSNL